MPAPGSFLVRIGTAVTSPGADIRPAASRVRPQAELAWPQGRAPLPPQRLDAEPASALPFSARWAGDFTVIGDGRVGGLALALEPAGTAPGAGSEGPEVVLRAWLSDRSAPVASRRGRFCFVLWDVPAQRLVAITDPFRTFPVCCAFTPGGMACASDARLLTGAGLLPGTLSTTALYHYLNFQYVPTTSAVWTGLHKLSGGERLDWQAGRHTVQAWWRLEYPADFEPGPEAAARELREQIVATVSSHRPAGDAGWGAFLSGGTDSSTICGLLAAASAPARVASFSIGFAEPGYDELGYARIASDHFGLDAHERRVGEQDAADALPRLVDAFDEPFGNASAIPTYFCAAMAADAGVGLLVAGDGGDEIFGGNERYLKDRIFGLYHGAPAPLRRLGSWTAGRLGAVDRRWPNRVRNFIERGSLPNPDRFYTDDSFASDHYDTLLTPGFRDQVARDDSLDLQRRVWAGLTAPDELHRLMHLDLTMAIADNDLVKVSGACRLAGVTASFPFLDRELVEFAARLPTHYKLKGMNKRALFKRAMADTLPEAIRRKKKQGFGLPVSVWMRQNGRFRQLVHDTLGSTRARSRGYFEPAAIAGLLERHQRGVWDHASELYSLLSLELWQRKHVDGVDG